MQASVIIGAQWGDEGKGKVVDALAQEYDYIVRFNGGNNAGHTIYVNGVKYVLHTIPSGVVYGGKRCLIGNGVVFNPAVLCEEIEALQKQGLEVTPKILGISYNAHIIMPYHIELDKLRENDASNKIGTTGKGIGPCYEDKVGRIGIRAGSFMHEEYVKERIERALKEKNILLKTLYNTKEFNADAVYEEIKPFMQKLAPYMCSVADEVRTALKENKKVLFEGAQGTGLDVDYGTYPYVTSSTTVTGGIATGSGIPPSSIGNIIAIVKAYTTRVGGGPFPTEQKNTIGDFLQTKGMEIGATTGRKRRCGWLDAVMLREAVQLNGITEIALTKLDILSGMERIQLCTGYMLHGKKCTTYPTEYMDMEEVVPVYEEFSGWKEDISSATSFEELPKEAQEYIIRIETLVGVPVVYISVGQERSQTIYRK